MLAPADVARARRRRALLLLGLLLAISLGAALGIGRHRIDWCGLLAATRSGSVDAEIVWSLRLPRALLAMLVGAALAVAGALMQALTRNRLAGPSLMGLGPGAALAMLGALVLAPPSPLLISAIALGGAAMGGALVLAVAHAGPRGATPGQLVLAGAVVGGLLHSLTGVVLLRLQLAELLLYWTLGGLASTTWAQVLGVVPLFVLGLTLAWALAPSLTVMQAGAEAARALGLRVDRVRRLAALAVLLLAGGAVAAAGPVGFVGVIVPNLCRPLTGFDLRAQLPVAALAGALLVLAADLVARLLVGPIIDLPLGVVTAVLGAPAVIWIARGGLTGPRS